MSGYPVLFEEIVMEAAGQPGSAEVLLVYSCWTSERPEGTALHWRSDRDRDPGMGSQALVTLSSGRHVITLTAADQDGDHATASITVYAGGKTYLPLVLRGQ